MDNLNLSGFFESEGFNSLDEESKSLLKEFSQKTDGKSPTEVMAVFMEYHGKLSKSGRIDKSRQKLLMDTLKAGLSPLDRKKFDLLEQLMAKQ